MKNRILLTTAVLCTVASMNAWAASPLPSFDKDAVTEYPYNRRGQQEAVAEQQKGSEEYRPGNTGTAEIPAFYVKEIKLTGYELPAEHNNTQLNAILGKYTSRSIIMDEVQQLTNELTAYARSCGLTVSQAVLPPQEVANGLLEIKIYAASYDSINLTKNNSHVADRVLRSFLEPLHPDEVIQDKYLERVINNINDLPGVTARAVLRPGARPVTTGLDVEVERRPVWNNYVFYDNGGSKSSGRYRYGFHTEINNPAQQGDKIGVTGYISSNDTKNYGVNYETAIDNRGTRWGIGYSKSTYDIGWINGFINPNGESEGLSFYGLTPLYRDREKRVTAIYGYDHRKIEDNMRISLGSFNETNTNEKSADVFHVGIAASEYQPNRFTSGNLIYWYGDIDTDVEGGAYYDGAYHKLTTDFSHVRYWKDWNLRLEAHAQLANRVLDGSERFYLGGMNSVRAYPSSETSGDTGYNATLELRRSTGIEGLEAAAFIDVGEVKLSKSGSQHQKLAGWGLGLRYSKPNDWYAQFDYAWKIDGELYASEDHDHDGRMWVQVYKMF